MKTNPTGTAGDTIPVHEIETHLERVLQHKFFHGSPQASRLLRHLVGHAGHQQRRELGEYAIGLAVFERKPESYHPGIDPIVRVQMGRLRGKLTAYYAAEGAADAIEISIPRGRYVPLFTRKAPLQTLPASASIVVLPFSCISVDPKDRCLSDGLTEELMFALASIPQLRVAARLMSRRAECGVLDLRSQAANLGIAHVVEGSVRFCRNRLRTVVRLLDVSGGHSLWTGRFDSDDDDSLDLQERLCAQILAAIEPLLRAHISGVALRCAGAISR